MTPTDMRRPAILAPFVATPSFAGPLVATLTLAAALALAVSGCSSSGPPPPVPVEGAPADLKALAGEWEGEYRSAETGRNGLITFRLSAGSDTARGDVVMHPRTGRSLEGEPAAIPDATFRTSRWISIRFVRVEGGEVSGTLAPYEDPDCKCEVRTTFIGRIQGDRVSGTFVTQHSEKEWEQRGVWNVVRKKK